jgi:dihydroxyacetone synthase
MSSSAVSKAVKGQPSYGKATVDGILAEAEAESASLAKLTSDQEHVLKTFRLLIADLCQQFKGGHPGGAIGMAAIGVALWKYVMRYAPHTPNYFNRDRFVLSNGHTCLFQYTFLHLTGFKDMTLDQLKSYHSDRVDMLCPGHPEIEHEGIEVTTGPLGQGVANAVGLAMATKHLAAKYNRTNFDLVSNHTWCMVGDACLQEGVALEAISLAGHWKLNNLTIIYDNNQITCDGSVDMCNTEDINTKMRATGFEVLDIQDGCFDIPGLADALGRSRTSKGKPTFINVRTIIGVGSAVAGDAIAHGAAFKPDDVAAMKKAYGFDPDEMFRIDASVRKFFEDTISRGEKLVEDWKSLLASYRKVHPELAKAFEAQMQGQLPADWQSHIPASFPDRPTATRASSGLVFNPVAAKVANFLVGTADLTPSVNMTFPDRITFNPPNLKPASGPRGNYTGRYIHYGIREHAMAAISNGLAAFSPGTIIPTTSSFFMFYLYAAPAVRMGALMRLQVIHAATHDSIGTGEDGPTHQPLELAALYRGMPNLLYFRPADSEETAGAWAVAILSKSTPSIISGSRHALPQLTGLTNRAKVAKGAYVVEEVEDADVTLISCGSEMHRTLEAGTILRETQGLKVRTLSFPCMRLFEQQPRSYQREVLQRIEGPPVVVVEAYVSTGWERYADAGVVMGKERFGQSLPGPKAYDYFGFGADKIAARIEAYLDDITSGEAVKGEWMEL